MPDWINRSDIFQDSENYQQENCGMNKLHRNEMISQCIDLAGQTGKAVTAFFITIFFFSLFAAEMQFSSICPS